jgi:hypothetical protein
MIRLKAGSTGARIAGLRTEALAGIMVAASVYADHGQPFVWTAGVDSKHMPGSLHYVGLAVDIGPPATNVKTVLLADLRLALGDDFDVVEEGDHVHIEFQPKRGMNL